MPYSTMPRPGLQPLPVALVCERLLLGRGLRRALAADRSLHVVHECVSRGAAVETLRPLRPAVVVLDVVTTQEATTTIDALAAGLPGSRLVVLAESHSGESAGLALEAGASGFATLQSGVHGLIAVIHEVAGRRVLPDRRRASLAPVAPARPPAPSLLDFLTAREHEVLALLGEGMSNRQIAKLLFVSVNTVRTHVQNVLTKLGVHSKLEAAAYAAHHR